MSLRSQTLWSILPLLSVTAVNILSVPLFYRYLGADYYALWLYVLTLSGAFGFMDLGLGVAVGRFIGLALGRNDIPAVRQYWGTGNTIAVPLLLLMAVAFSATGALLGPKWFQVPPGGERLLRWSFLAAGPGLFLSYYGQFWNILAQAHLDFRFLALVRTILSIVSVCVAIGLARLTGSPLILVWWSVVVAAIQLTIYVWHSVRSYGMHFHFLEARLQRAREMSGYTLKTFLGLLVGAIAATTDRLLIGRLVPAAQFAHYSVASNVGGRLQTLGGSILGPVFHQSNRAISESGLVEVRRIHAEAFSLVFPWCILPFFVVLIWGRPLLRVWLGYDLAEAVLPVFLPVVLASSLQVTCSISGAQLSSLDRQGSVVALQLLGTLLTLVFGTIGWHFAGLPGFAWGIAASRLAGLGQDILLMSMVGRLGWLTKAALRTVLMQAAIALSFLLLSFIATDWRTAAGVGVVHAMVGALPSLKSWTSRCNTASLCG